MEQNNVKQKSLKELSLNITEEEYRNDPALSYSILAKYEREGFNKLDSLFDKVESPSLTFGSAVDTLITGGQEEFDKLFQVASIPKASETLVRIAQVLFDTYHEEYQSIAEIPDEILAQVGKDCDFWANPKYDNHRVKLIKEGCAGYYNTLYEAKGRTILSEETYQDVINSVQALKTSSATKWYFQEDDPFNPHIERLYQLKFKAPCNTVDYRCMADLLVVNHEEKLVQPVDLKTSSHTEWDFYKSFVTWRYDIQARLYWYIIRYNMNKDSYFKYFTLLDYQFIVVNKQTLTPLVWECPFTQQTGLIRLGQHENVQFRSPFIIGEELSYYLKDRPRVPIGIKANTGNDLRAWINQM